MAEEDCDAPHPQTSGGRLELISSPAQAWRGQFPVRQAPCELKTALVK